MVRVSLKGINRVRKRLADGTIAYYHYHRATGTKLPGDVGSPDFLAAYQAAERPPARDAGTVAGLIREYLASPRFGAGDGRARALRHSTQREYKRMLGPLEERFGTMPILALASPSVVGEFIDYQEEVGLDRPREADNRLTVLSAVFTYARRKGRISRNPLDGFERLYAGDRAEVIWTEADVTTFMRTAPVELQRAMILGIHTAQRYGDLIRLRWSDYDGDFLSLKQSKTSQRVAVKCSAALKAMIAATPRQGPFILTRSDGRPWHTANDDKRLGKEWREHMKACGLYSSDPTTRLRFHDLRGTAVTLLALAGVSVPQIVAITGHTLQSANRILEKYLARTRQLAEVAVYRFENATETAFANQLQTSSSNLPTPSTKAQGSQ
ncbi:MAG: tyrosine-type recombinase/integrase [Bauldia sp.]